MFYQFVIDALSMRTIDECICVYINCQFSFQCLAIISLKTQ